MSRLILGLALSAALTACGEAQELEPASVAPAEVVEMDEAMISIPASELEMLEQEVAFLRDETKRMQTELAETEDAPAPKLVARQVSARSHLIQAEQQLARLKAELEETKTRLAASEAKNVELEADLVETREVLVETSERLTRTEKSLARTRDDLDSALMVAADAGWSDLVSQSQAALCPKGGRKKMDRCRTEARASVAHLEPAARACLRAGHAAPQLQGRAPGESMPKQAVWIGESTEDWYVVMCDPTLPEARALLAEVDDRGRMPGSSAPLVDAADEPIERATKRTARTSSVRTVSREQPTRRPSRDDSPEPEDLLEPDEGDSDGVNLSALGLEDLDNDRDAKPSKADRKREKEEEARLEAASRRRVRLDRAGSDLSDLEE